MFQVYSYTVDSGYINTKSCLKIRDSKRSVTISGATLNSFAFFGLKFHVTVTGSETLGGVAINGGDCMKVK